MSRAMGKLVGDDVQLESDEFNRAFRVTSDNRRFATDVLHARTHAVPAGPRQGRIPVAGWPGDPGEPRPDRRAGHTLGAGLSRRDPRSHPGPCTTHPRQSIRVNSRCRPPSPEGTLVAVTTAVIVYVTSMPQQVGAYRQPTELAMVRWPLTQEPLPATGR